MMVAADMLARTGALFDAPDVYDMPPTLPPRSALSSPPADWSRTLALLDDDTADSWNSPGRTPRHRAGQILVPLIAAQLGSARPQARERIAVSILVRFTNTSPTTTEQYDQSVQRLQQVGDFPPDGMEDHVCFIVDGNIRVSEIWESREKLNAFAERLMPVLAEMGVEPGEPEILEIHNIIRR
jgi:hypothetical protein